MKETILLRKKSDGLNSKVGKTFTHKELIDFVSKRPNKIKALIS